MISLKSRVKLIVFTPIFKMIETAYATPIEPVAAPVPDFVVKVDKSVGEPLKTKDAKTQYNISHTSNGQRTNEREEESTLKINIPRKTKQANMATKTINTDISVQTN